MSGELKGSNLLFFSPENSLFFTVLSYFSFFLWESHLPWGIGLNKVKPLSFIFPFPFLCQFYIAILWVGGLGKCFFSFSCLFLVHLPKAGGQTEQKARMFHLLRPPPPLTKTTSPPSRITFTSYYQLPGATPVQRQPLLLRRSPPRWRSSADLIFVKKNLRNKSQ